jgi:hypothetical protein
MFCQSCGSQMTGAFCTKCGARANQAAPPAAPPPPPPVQQFAAPLPPPPQYAPPPQYVQPLPPAAKSGSGLKILLVVLVILGLMGMLAVGGVWYAWHKTKEIAASKGIDLNSFSETHNGPARRVDACDLLTKEDLSRILNLNVDRVEGGGRATHSTCRYYSSGASQRAQDEAIAAKKKLDEAAKSGNSTPDAAQVEQVGNMIRGITGAAGNAGDAPMLSIEVETQNAKAAMAGFKIAMGLTGLGVMKDAPPGAANLVHEEVKGIGDEAMFGPLLSLSMFRKGDVSLQIDGRLLPGGRDAQIAIAKTVFSKL